MSYVDVNGLSLYYEEHGGGDAAGTPLVLLHGGLGTGDMFGSALTELARDRRVITVDLEGHGRTADVGRPLRFETMADDIAELIQRLELTEVDAMGYSLGDGTALRLAIQHPELIRRLVIVSQPHKRDAWYPEVRANFDQMGRHLAEMLMRSPIYAAYEKVAPRVEDFPVLLDKVADLGRQDYDWSAEIGAITAPVMLVFGDADSVSPAHIAEFYALLGGGQRDGNWDGSTRSAARLAILPDHIHTDVVAAPELATAATSFLDTTTLVPPPLG